MTHSKNIVIAGATSAIARGLLIEISKRSGYNVLSVSRSNQDAAIYNGNNNLRVINGVDLTDRDDLERLAYEASAFFGSAFNVIVFSGNFWRHKPLVVTEITEIKSMISSHFESFLCTAKYLIPVMASKGGGRIIALSCNSVSYNYPDMSPFTASKAAIESAIRCIGNEYAQLGIATTAVALPTIRTEEVVNEKACGDHNNYISVPELSELLLDHMLSRHISITGNTERIIKYSPTFYGKAYLERNPRRPEHERQMSDVANSVDSLRPPDAGAV